MRPARLASVLRFLPALLAAQSNAASLIGIAGGRPGALAANAPAAI